jgi:hypothetical protein
MTKYIISLEEAQKRISAWRKDQEDILKALDLPDYTYYSPLHIKALTFTTDDLFDLCEQIYNYNHQDGPRLSITRITEADPVNAIRFYIGKNEGDDPQRRGACLVAVPVTGFDAGNKKGGKDLIALPFGRMGEIIVPSIHDFSYPCPATCANRGEGIMDKLLKPE